MFEGFWTGVENDENTVVCGICGFAVCLYYSLS